MDVPIIPCGITYINKDKWRGQVVVQYGQPIMLSKERLEHFRADKKSEVKKLTDEMEHILYSLTLNSPDWETMRLLHAARRIYFGDQHMTVAEYVEITRRFSQFYMKSKDHPDVQNLRKDIATYQDKLDELHLKDVHVGDL